MTLLGIVLGFLGVALTFITFFAPGTVQKLALRRADQWVKIPSFTMGNKAYRHRIFSGFTIEVRLSDPVCEDFYEFWMEALYRPDPRATSYYVTLFFNGLPMKQLLFLEYDGGRNFIPVPTNTRVGDKLYASFSPDHEQMANIVGYDYHGRNFKEVAASIVDSRFNPFFLSLPENGLQERLEKLQGDIEALKSKLAVSRM